MIKGYLLLLLLVICNANSFAMENNENGNNNNLNNNNQQGFFLQFKDCVYFENDEQVIESFLRYAPFFRLSSHSLRRNLCYLVVNRIWSLCRCDMRHTSDTGRCDGSKQDGYDERRAL